MSDQQPSFHDVDGALSRIRQILVGTSLGPDSDVALEAAFDLARQRNAKVHVMHVLANPPIPYGAERGAVSYNWIQQLLVDRQEALRTKVAELARELPEDHITSSVEFGTAYRHLLETASRRGSDLIVVSASEDAHRLLGSTPGKLVRKARCPVLVVRGRHALPFRRILLPVDLSTLSADSFRCGLSFLSQTCNDQAVEIHPLLVLDEAMLGHKFSQERLRRFAREELDHFVEENSSPTSHPLTAACLRFGDPRDEILKQAETSGSDLIVIGTHGHSGLERALIGSVAEGVVRHAKTSVLVIPPNVSFGAELVDAVAEQIEPRFEVPPQEQTTMTKGPGHDPSS